MTKIAIGIDIGGTNTAFGLINEQGECLAESSVPTNKYSEINEYIDYLAESIKAFIQSQSTDYSIQGIGIGAPNGNYHKGTVEFAPNLKWGNVVPLANLMKEKFGLPVWLTNDANAAALGEKLYGGGKNTDDFLFITLGTGLGSGIISNGELLYGHDGFAGELGHVIVKENGRQCNCGRKGCLETYASASGIKRTAFELLAESNKESKLYDYTFKELSAKIIYEEAVKGDEIARKAFDYTAEILGKALANSVAYTSPKAIFLFGGLANAGDLLFVPVKKYFEQNLLTIYKNKTDILPSQLKNGQAAIIGAAALVWTNLNLSPAD